MSSDSELRPGVGLIWSGLVFACLASMPVATGMDSGLKGLLFGLGGWVIGAALWKVGWHRLQRAKEVRPDLTWWQFLHNDLIVLGICALLLTAAAAMPREQLDALLQSLREFAETLYIARGWP